MNWLSGGLNFNTLIENSAKFLENLDDVAAQQLGTKSDSEDEPDVSDILQQFQHHENPIAKPQSPNQPKPVQQFHPHETTPKPKPTNTNATQPANRPTGHQSRSMQSATQPTPKAVPLTSEDLFADFDDDVSARKTAKTVTNAPRNPVAVSKPAQANREKEQQLQKSREIEKARVAKTEKPSTTPTNVDRAENEKSAAPTVTEEKTAVKIERDVSVESSDPARNEAIVEPTARLVSEEPVTAETNSIAVIGLDSAGQDPEPADGEAHQDGGLEEAALGEESSQAQDEDVVSELEEEEPVSTEEQEAPIASPSQQPAAQSHNNPMDAIKQLGGGLLESFMHASPNNQQNANPTPNQMKDYISREQYNLLKAEYKKMYDQMRVLSDKYRENESQHEQTKEECRRLEALLQEKDRERSEAELILRQSVDSDQEKIKQLQNQLVQKERTEQLLESMKEDNARLKQDIEVNKQEINNYKSEVELLSEKSRQLSNEMSIMNREHQSVIEKLQRDNQTLSIKLDNEQKELKQYKAKANSLLEAKNVIPAPTINEDYISLQNYYSIKLENEKLKTTQQAALTSAEKYKLELIELKESTNEEIQELKRQLEITEKENVNFKKVAEAQNIELTEAKSLIQKLQIESHVQVNNLSKIIQEKEQKLKVQASPFKESHVSPDLFEKCRALTEEIKTKQVQIEILESENSTLKVSLENSVKTQQISGHDKFSDPHYEYTKTNKRNKGSRTFANLVRNYVNKEDFFEDGPSSQHRLVKMASTVDQITGALGGFFKLYPLARFLALLYLVFFHIYIFYVLNLWSSAITVQQKDILENS